MANIYTNTEVLEFVPEDEQIIYIDPNPENLGQAGYYRQRINELEEENKVLEQQLEDTEELIEFNLQEISRLEMEEEMALNAER